MAIAVLVVGMVVLLDRPHLAFLAATKMEWFVNQGLRAISHNYSIPPGAWP